MGSSFLKGLLLLGVFSAISLGLVFAYQYFLASPYLKLKHVEMIGVDEEFKVELMRDTGLNQELSLLALNLNELRRKMEGHPWIRAARLERRFPDTLVVEVERETPRALVLTDKVYYMNPWGELFIEVTDSDKKDVPVITGVSGEATAAEDQLARVAKIMKDLESEQGQWSIQELSEVHVREDGGVSLYFSHVPAEINLIWDDLGSKMELLKKAVAHLTQTGRIHEVSSIDLNYLEGVVVSFKTG